MQNHAMFPLSVVLRLILAMLLPIQVLISVGVTSTQLSGFGMVWTMSSSSLEIQYLSVPIAILCSIPAVLFSAFLKYSSQESYPVKVALLSTFLVFIVPLTELMLTQTQDEWTFLAWPFYSPWFVPVGYSAALFIGLIFLPSLNHLIRSSGFALLSHETIMSLAVLAVGLFGPFVLLFNRGVYGLDESVLSSGFITLSSVRSGWTSESGFFYLQQTLVSDLNPLFMPFYVILALRMLFVLLAISCILGRISLTKTFFVGLFQEVVLLVLSFLVNSSIPPAEYYSSGVVSIPFLFPLLLFVLLVQWKIRESRATGGIEYVTVPATVSIRYKWMEFKRKLIHRREWSES
jgi:hypothetical protein